MSEINMTIPVVALRGMTVLPDMVIHFDVSRDKSIKAIQTAMEDDQNVLLILSSILRVRLWELKICIKWERLQK